ncbi:MAG TPA: asparagine synthase-related protein [Solirubrobacterales bacterium]|jgi:asparagine synthase (glutamine-hydrolysing)
MSRWLAGTFDPSGRLDPARLAGALAPHATRTLQSGPLSVACSGPPVPASVPLCLLDGVLDNAEELQDELGLSGSPADEHLLAVGYRRWRRELPRRLRGDFVVLLWDPERGEGLLARDQLGVRPCYLSESGEGLRFASEVRHLLALLPRQPQPDPASVAHWIGVSTRPGMQTLWAGVRRLRPGGMLLFDRHGVSEATFWAPRFEEPLEMSAGEIAAEVREELARAVTRRIAADGATGVLMSGGLDSSAVAALGARARTGRIRTCSATFPDHPETDESELIGDLRRALQLPGVIAEVRMGGLLGSALEHQGAWRMPLLGWGDFWTLPLMRMAAAEGVSTMLDGDGGDELFGPRVYLLADRLLAGHPLEALRLAVERPGGGRHVPRREVARVFRSEALGGAIPYRLHDLRRTTVVERTAPAWLRRRALDDLVASDDPFAWKRLDGPRWWAHAAYGVTRGIEEAGVFEHQRRRAALAGLSARHPILDLDLVELALRQPPRATLDRRFNRPVLRESMVGLLPDAVRLRPGKARFERLIADCLDGADGAAVREILTAPGLELGAYVEPVAMRRALFDSDELRRNSPFRWMWQVWRLLTAELWLRSLASPIGFAEGLPAASPSRVEVAAAGASTTFSPLEQTRASSRVVTGNR